MHPVIKRNINAIIEPLSEGYTPNRQKNLTIILIISFIIIF